MNLIPKSRSNKKVKASNAKPEQLKNTEQSRRSRLQISAESDKENWLPLVRAPRLAATSVDVSTQTVTASFFVVKQITHNDMRELQVEKSVSDQEMLAIARFVRLKTGCNRIIEPCFKDSLVEGHKLFDDLFNVSSITRIPLTPKPLVICSDTRILFEQIEKHFQRKIRVVHQGVDSGGGFLKFDAE